jgi:hypothetical protein
VEHSWFGCPSDMSGEELHRRLLNSWIKGFGLAIARGLGFMTITWERAMAHMRAALALLDESNAPPHIGAHLDMVISRLDDAIAEQGLASRTRQKTVGSNLP